MCGVRGSGSAAVTKAAAAGAEAVVVVAAAAAAAAVAAVVAAAVAAVVTALGAAAVQGGTVAGLSCGYHRTCGSACLSSPSICTSAKRECECARVSRFAFVPNCRMTNDRVAPPTARGIEHRRGAMLLAQHGRHALCVARTKTSINRTPISPPPNRANSRIGPFFTAPAFASICRQREENPCAGGGGELREKRLL